MCNSITNGVTGSLVTALVTVPPTRPDPTRCITYLSELRNHSHLSPVFNHLSLNRHLSNAREAKRKG